MAIIKQGIMGGYSKKLGGTIGTSWKGIAVVRTPAQSITNPRTAAQIANRTNFKMWALVGQSLLTGICKPLWDRFAKRMSGYNAFVRANKKLQDAMGASWTVSNLIISQGRLGYTVPTLGTVETSSIVVNWPTTPVGSYQQSTDTAFISVIAYDPVTMVLDPTKCEGFNTGIARSVGTAELTLTPGMFDDGDGIVVSLAFRRSDGTLAGETSSVTETL